MKRVNTYGLKVCINMYCNISAIVTLLIALYEIRYEDLKTSKVLISRRFK